MRQCEQIFLTEDFTFIPLCLETPRNTCAPAVWIELQFYSITHEHFYSVQTHLAGKVCQNDFSSVPLYAKQSVRKRLIDDAFDNLWFSHIDLRE